MTTLTTTATPWNWMLTHTGVAVPRPRALMAVLLFLAFCTLCGLALEVALVPYYIEHLATSGSMPDVPDPESALWGTQISGALFIAGILAVMLGFMAFGHAWARRMWVVCMLLGVVAVPNLLIAILTAPPIAIMKGVLCLLYLIGTACLFKNTINHWFRALNALRNAAPGVGLAPEAAPAVDQAAERAVPGSRPVSLLAGLALMVLQSIVMSMVVVLFGRELFTALYGRTMALILQTMEPALSIASVLATVLMMALALLVARGSAVARWICVALVVLYVLMSLPTLLAPSKQSDMAFGLLLLLNGVSLLSIVLLMLPASSRWMRGMQQQMAA
ncbi:MAG: hypothetical protein RLZZ618_160 [Pseudomonadota bacterium]